VKIVNIYRGWAFIGRKKIIIEDNYLWRANIYLERVNLYGA